ncbi:PREDICTED: lysM domain receptor-like kinase 3 isoform X1 [Nelumbo nucifera]|uniref:non-specific serine/threonine protein kinase n=1 Tax=Nelumbo nucifera TaxID=4432 RepID=A0A1U7ZHK1_NELNU|nr:PREDICTED: lysM domain receptor-like kinase 3 isoform X1 [Nelumbo nucifera]
MVAAGSRRYVLSLGLGILVFTFFCAGAEAKCSSGCGLALASYYIWQGTNISFISEIFSASREDIVSYNSLSTQDFIPFGTKINIPFSCECLKEDFLSEQVLGHVFNYSVRSGDVYSIVAETYYSNLTTVEWLEKFNTYSASGIPDNAHLNVTVNCSCGDSSVSKDYGLFTTYPLRPVDTLASVASEFNISASLLQSYNPNTNFSLGSGLVFVPTKDQTGSYRPLNSSAGISSGAIAGISIAVVAGTLLLAVSVYFQIYKRKKAKGAVLLTTAPDDSSTKHGHGTLDKTTEIVSLVGASPGLTGLTVEKSVEFSYEELAEATNDFNLAGKIGQGGFGSVYYAELRGQKAAIKKMDMKASREFLAELKVLTRVHHLNLVRLIGYCIEGSLCLVYEFIDNGNLSQHLHGFGREPLTWSTRVQIALDSARGLEYIHEHTVPVYIHRDIKSANILIDKNFHGKVADFGLTKLTEVGSASLSTRLAGTFGYMPPEYAQYGDVSPKVDVYAFGVVLYELISAKEAIVRTNGSETESKGLVGLFEDVLSQPEPKENLRKLVDPRLGDNCPLDSVHKMAQLARACTHETPAQRPSMRSVGVALMALSSSTGDWDVGTFYENQALVNLMSGR